MRGLGQQVPSQSLTCPAGLRLPAPGARCAAPGPACHGQRPPGEQPAPTPACGRPGSCLTAAHSHRRPDLRTLLGKAWEGRGLPHTGEVASTRRPHLCAQLADHHLLREVGGISLGARGHAARIWPRRASGITQRLANDRRHGGSWGEQLLKHSERPEQVADDGCCMAGRAAGRGRRRQQGAGAARSPQDDRLQSLRHLGGRLHLRRRGRWWAVAVNAAGQTWRASMSPWVGACRGCRRHAQSVMQCSPSGVPTCCSPLEHLRDSESSMHARPSRRESSARLLRSVVTRAVSCNHPNQGAQGGVGALLPPLRAS